MHGYIYFKVRVDHYKLIVHQSIHSLATFKSNLTDQLDVDGHWSVQMRNSDSVEWSMNALDQLVTFPVSVVIG